VDAKLHEKTDIFCGLCKKDKKILIQSHFLTPKFVFLYMTQKMSGFMLLFCEHIECQDVYANIFIQKNLYYKMFLNQNLKSGNIKHHPLLLLYNISIQALYFEVVAIIS
jgi:hypothetical protein